MMGKAPAAAAPAEKPRTFKIKAKPKAPAAEPPPPPPAEKPRTFKIKAKPKAPQPPPPPPAEKPKKFIVKTKPKGYKEFREKVARGKIAKALLKRLMAKRSGKDGE